jgi:hypothetical protein
MEKIDVQPYDSAVEFGQDFLDTARWALVDGEHLLAECSLHSAERYFKAAGVPMPAEITDLKRRAYEMGLEKNESIARSANGADRGVAEVRAKEYREKLARLTARGGPSQG